MPLKKYKFHLPSPQNPLTQTTQTPQLSGGLCRPGAAQHRLGTQRGACGGGAFFGGETAPQGGFCRAISAVVVLGLWVKREPKHRASLGMTGALGQGLLYMNLMGRLSM